jgi:hypothetical protein
VDTDSGPLCTRRKGLLACAELKGCATLAKIS